MIKNKTYRIAEIKKQIHKEMQKQKVDTEAVEKLLAELKELEENSSTLSRRLEYSKDNSQPL